MKYLLLTLLFAFSAYAEAPDPLNPAVFTSYKDSDGKTWCLMKCGTGGGWSFEGRCPVLTDLEIDMCYDVATTTDSRERLEEKAKERSKKLNYKVAVCQAENKKLRRRK